MQWQDRQQDWQQDRQQDQQQDWQLLLEPLVLAPSTLLLMLRLLPNMRKIRLMRNI